jgi:disulfide oxidoreductase YuzD
VQRLANTYPYVDIREDDAEMGHEASVSKISEDQLFYLMSRDMTADSVSKGGLRLRSLRGRRHNRGACGGWSGRAARP